MCSYKKNARDGNRINSYLSIFVILGFCVCVCVVLDNAETLEHIRIWTSSAVNMFRDDTLLLFLTAPATVLYIQSG